MTTPQSPVIPESIVRHNAMIEKANLRLEELWAAKVHAVARIMGQGVEICIERPSFRGRNWASRSYEIIPY